MYKHIGEAWKKNRRSPQQKQRMIQWRKEPISIKIERPTRLDKARALGYKAKQGIIVVRIRVNGGGRMREKFMGGRRPKARRRKKVLAQNFQGIAEQRAQRDYTNLEVLNSYYAGKEKNDIWYEVILVDPNHPRVKDEFSWMLDGSNRALRGKTSAQRRSRGLVRPGKGSNILTAQRL